jgi:glutathione S-transferase
MKLELISFKICPFVQRAVITLLYKQASFTVTHIDLSEPPDWFEAMSPFGKVPVLKVDDRHVIFESAIIDEFLDDVTPGSLLPDEPLTRALNRSWIDFGSACLLDLSGMMHAKDQESFDSNRDTLLSRLDWLEGILAGAPYFNGGQLSLVDFAYAPLFMRSDILGLTDLLFPPESRPRSRAWSQALLQLPAVQGSVVEGFPDLLREHIRVKAPFAAQQFGI